jgi:hypothetical protein
MRLFLGWKPRVSFRVIEPKLAAAPVIKPAVIVKDKTVAYVLENTMKAIVSVAAEGHNYISRELTPRPVISARESTNRTTCYL